jgi:hypothetical protein
MLVDRPKLALSVVEKLSNDHSFALPEKTKNEQRAHLRIESVLPSSLMRVPFQ